MSGLGPDPAARVTVQVAGDELRTRWVDPAELGGPDQLLAAVADAVDDGRLLPVTFLREGNSDGRHVSGRHVEWFDVEVRRR